MKITSPQTARMRLRFVTTIVRSRAASPARLLECDRQGDDGPGDQHERRLGQIEIRQPEPDQGRHHDDGQPEIAPGWR